MVDPISTSGIRPRVTRPGEDAGVTVQGSAVGAAASAVPTAAGDSVKLSPAAQALPEELKSGPPVDLQIVAKIKEAIAEGKYPIDLEAITESLFENYLELVS
ncbi:MAG: flagellar biosynthesis anti-sigma factor FlgM [Paracoccaceae bacterium]|uniref:Negative regulator of flagellin synthesis n=1 Tax=Paragemmobacter kunshanensis TaxID=2583234 RepID=A0A6M1TSU0_9RHOB|nr:flagellar biosynthesis anti-sigma factor FlgM [Rhodobacter kunshanensis]NGQ90076.1 flagellar biosynthesis anti-sigma factor FlgM [Rhodobacter kunshanensis]